MGRTGLLFALVFLCDPAIAQVIHARQKDFNESVIERRTKEVGYSAAATLATIIDPRRLEVVEAGRRIPPLSFPDRSLWYVVKSRYVNPDRPIWLTAVTPGGKNQILAFVVIPMTEYAVGYLPGSRLRGTRTVVDPKNPDNVATVLAPASGSLESDQIPAEARKRGVVALHNGVFRQEHNVYTLDDGRRVGAGVLDSRIPSDRHPMHAGLATAVVDGNGFLKIVRWDDSEVSKISGRFQARQMGFPLVLDGKITPETIDWKNKGYTGKYDLAVRSYLAVRRKDQLAAYVYTEKMTPLEAAQMLVRLNFDDAMLLEIHEVVMAGVDQTPLDGPAGPQRFGKFISNGAAMLAMRDAWIQNPVEGTYEKDIFYYSVRDKPNVTRN